MVQFAVTLKDGTWTVFADGSAIEHGLSRSAAVEMAKTLAFQAEAHGEPVELLLQGYYGEVARRLSGARSDEP